MHNDSPGDKQTMRFKKGWAGSTVFGCIVAAMASAPIAAQTLADAGVREGDFLELLAQENHVYSAARYVQTMAETPANVTVITRDELRRFGYRSIASALAALPGVYDAASQWPALGVRGFAVPGDFGSRILTLINGMPIYEATYGGFFIEQIDMESIDRIEFVKGPGSALYGSGAVLAVVNIITRSGRDTGGKTVSLEAASRGKAKLYGSWGDVGKGGTDTFVSVSATKVGGRDIYLREFDTPAFDQARFHGISAGNDGLDTVRLFGRATYDNAWVQGLYVGADRDDPLASYGTVFNGRLRLRESLAAVEGGMTFDLGSGTLATARAYLFDVAEKGDYPYASSGARIPPADYINVSDLASRQIGAEFRYDRFFLNGHHLLAGVEAKRVDTHQEVGDQPGPARSGVVTVDSRPGYSQWALFLQDEMHFWKGTLFLGVRYDDYSGFSAGVTSRMSPRVAYLQNLSENTTAKLIYGEAYRAPTVYESLYQDGIPAAETLWANPKLRPELARTFEALLEHQPAQGVKWRLGMFRTRLSDSPEQVVTPVYNGVACDLGPDACIQYRNSGVTQSVNGIEADVRIRRIGSGSLYASAVFQKSSENGNELPSSPRQLVKFGASRALPWSGLDGAVEVHYVGGVRGRLTESGARTADAPAYVLVNATLNAEQMAGGWRASLRVVNLLDRAIYTIASRELQPLERVPADGRRFSLQLQHDF
jgi:iron complex outermembrane receptor protein